MPEVWHKLKMVSILGKNVVQWQRREQLWARNVEMLNIFSTGKGPPIVGRKLNHWRGHSKVLGLKPSTHEPGLT